MSKISKKKLIEYPIQTLYLGLMKTRQSITRQYGTDFGLPILWQYSGKQCSNIFTTQHNHIKCLYLTRSTISYITIYFATFYINTYSINLAYYHLLGLPSIGRVNKIIELHLPTVLWCFWE